MRTRYFYGYNIVAVSFLIQAICIGAFVTYGVFFKEFQDEFGWSRAMISGASSVAILMLGAMTILAGRLNDMIGPRSLTLSAGIFLGMGYFLMSFIQKPCQLFLLYGVVIGAGFSPVEIVTLSTIARWFTRRRGMMSGIVKVGTGFGQLFIPLIATSLIAVYGWRHSYMIMGVALLIILLIFSGVLKRDPHGMGLMPDNETDKINGSILVPPDLGVTLKTAVRTKQLWLLCMSWFAILFSLMTILVHIVPHALDLGMTNTTAAGVLSTIGGISMVGRFCMGTLSDKIGSKRAAIISAFLLLSAFIWLQVARNAWMLFFFAAANGFAHGALYTLNSLLIADLFGTRSHGVLFGIVWFSGHAGGAIGPLLAGQVFDVTGSYRITFLILAAAVGLGLLLILMLKPLKVNPGVSA
ncbi:MAG: MFS transporter [Deltaproteobacteria bacterium]|nr:MFS transporter [Deltaproteobacteria bacterium]